MFEIGALLSNVRSDDLPMYNEANVPYIYFRAIMLVIWPNGLLSSIFSIRDGGRCLVVTKLDWMAYAVSFPSQDPNF